MGAGNWKKNSGRRRLTAVRFGRGSYVPPALLEAVPVGRFLPPALLHEGTSGARGRKGPFSDIIHLTCPSRHFECVGFERVDLTHSLRPETRGKVLKISTGQGQTSAHARQRVEVGGEGDPDWSERNRGWTSRDLPRSSHMASPIAPLFILRPGTSVRGRTYPYRSAFRACFA